MVARVAKTIVHVMMGRIAIGVFTAHRPSIGARNDMNISFAHDFSS
jgi:alkanesulfonate monooxygenase SsuD/methylene tetrahydromethanopterin reductase-like flavin-dependent oxidoreductase (luciferase family)